MSALELTCNLRVTTRSPNGRPGGGRSDPCNQANRAWSWRNPQARCSWDAPGRLVDTPHLDLRRTIMMDAAMTGPGMHELGALLGHDTTALLRFHSSRHECPGLSRRAGWRNSSGRLGDGARPPVSASALAAMGGLLPGGRQPVTPRAAAQRRAFASRLGAAIPALVRFSSTCVSVLLHTPGSSATGHTRTPAFPSAR